MPQNVRYRPNDSGAGGRDLEAGSSCVGVGDGVEKPLDQVDVPLGCSVECFFDEVVAGDVDGVDRVHRFGVRIELGPAPCPGVERCRIEEHSANDRRVCAGDSAQTRKNEV